MPMSGKQRALSRFVCSINFPFSPFSLRLNDVLYCERLGILLGLGWVESDAIEELFRLEVLTRGLKAHLLRDLTIDVRPMDLVDNVRVVGSILDHAPTAKLCEPPHSM